MVSYKVSYIVIDKDNYEDEFEFEEAIKDTVMTLLRNKQILTINYDERNVGVVVIEHEVEDRSWGFRYPYWLTPEEIDLVETNKEGEE